MRTWLFVINPISGDRDKSYVSSTILGWAKSNHQKVDFWNTTGEDDLGKLQQYLQDHTPEAVIAVGGDGTVLLCAHAVKDTEIALGLLPEGSANGMAAELGIPQDLDEALAILLKGKTLSADMLCFNDQEYGLHISDVGLNARLVKDFEEGDQRGLLGYARGVVSNIVQTNPFKVTLELDDEEVTEEAYMVAFGNATKYGTGAKLSPNGTIDDGKFEVYVLREINLAGIAGQFFGVFEDDAAYYKVYQVKEARIHLAEAQPFQIDGELKEPTREVSVKIIPGCLRLIAS